MLPFIRHSDIKPWQSVKAFSNKLHVPRWWLMAISQRTFYGDESGSHGDGPFVMSGYLATDQVWGELEDQWHCVLQDATIADALSSISICVSASCWKANLKA